MSCRVSWTSPDDCSWAIHLGMGGGERSGDHCGAVVQRAPSRNSCDCFGYRRRNTGVRRYRVTPHHRVPCIRRSACAHHGILAFLSGYWPHNAHCDVGFLGPSSAIGKMVAAFALGVFSGVVTASSCARRWFRARCGHSNLWAVGRAADARQRISHSRFRRDPARVRIFGAGLVSTTRIVVICLMFAFSAEFLLRDLLPSHLRVRLYRRGYLHTLSHLRCWSARRCTSMVSRRCPWFGDYLISACHPVRPWHSRFRRRGQYLGRLGRSHWFFGRQPSPCL